MKNSLIGIDNQLKLHVNYGQHAKENYSRILEMIEGCHKVYATAPNYIKHLFNQALFAKVLVYSSCNLSYEAADSFDPVISIKAHNKKESANSSGFFDTFISVPNTLKNFFGAGLNNDKMVGKTGFEPATPWSQTKCSTKLSYFP